MGEEEMRGVLCILLLGVTLCVAFNSDNDGHIAALDDLALVEVEERADCAAEILQAKTKCAEKVAYYKKIHDTNCGNTELKDQNSLRAKANKATSEAVALAEKEPSMEKVTPKAAEAKQLFAKMVEEKIHLARARYAKKNSKKSEQGTEKLIQKLYEEAKKAREKELGEMKKVKSASVKVAEEGSKISKEETKVAREERDGSKKQKEKAQKAKADKDQSKVQKAQSLVDKLQKDLAAAQAEEKKTQNLSLKGLLSQADNLINSKTRERDEDN